LEQSATVDQPIILLEVAWRNMRIGSASFAVLQAVIGRLLLPSSGWLNIASK
jgi:hypothetical protein